MERVEEATHSSPQTISVDTRPAKITPTKPHHDEDTKASSSSSSNAVAATNEKESSVVNITAEAWKPLLNLGIEFLESIINTNTNSKSSVPTGPIKDFARKIKIEKDEKTGEFFL